MIESQILTGRQVADLLGRAVKTLTNWRLEGRGPAWVVDPDTGRFLGYRPEDVEAWITSGRTGQSVAP